MVDKTLILRKLSELDEYCKQIKEYDKITVVQYSGDWKIQRIIERTLQMMIETCVDIASHPLASQLCYLYPSSLFPRPSPLSPLLRLTFSSSQFLSFRPFTLACPTPDQLSLIWSDNHFMMG